MLFIFNLIFNTFTRQFNIFGIKINTDEPAIEFNGSDAGGATSHKRV